jgi:glucose/arabinose dehydrogenase
MYRQALAVTLWLGMAVGARATPAFSVPSPNLFRVTVFASGLQYPQAMQQMADGSLLVQTSPGFATGQLLRFTDTNLDGIADGPGVSVFSSATGPLTGLLRAGAYFIQGNYGSHTIEILKPGALPTDPMTVVGTLSFDYGPGIWWHDTIGIAVRPTPGVPGSYDLVFNVGSKLDDVHTTDQVSLSGLISGQLNAESLYVVTLDLSGPVPSASNLRLLASGIRNSFGLAFQPGTGDLYFGDNAIDGFPEPPQADELNRILAADFAGSPQNFGFPDCYPDYNTGAIVGAGCSAPLVAFTPLGGARSQGVAQIAFAPPDFPAGFNNGVFLGFAGQVLAGGTVYNPVVYFDFGSGEFMHFVAEGTLNRPIGLLAAADSLFISDFGSGTVYQVSANGVPEPSTAVLLLVGMLMLAWTNWRMRRASGGR